MPSSVSREAQNLALWAAGQAERAPEQPPAQNELTMLAQAMGQLAPPNHSMSCPLFYTNAACCCVV